MAPLLLALVLAASGAPESEALQEGVRLYEGRQHAAALSAFTRALDQAGSRSERARVHLYIGLIQHRYELIDDARSSFARALNLDPRAALPEPASEGARRLFAQLEPKLAERKEEKRKRVRARRGSPRAPSPEEPEDEEDADLEPLPERAPVLAVTEPPEPLPAVELELDPTAEPEGRGAAPWIAAGASGAGVILGGIFMGLALGNHAAANDAMVAADAAGRYDTALGQRSVALVSFGVAAAAAGLAIYLFTSD